MKSIVATILTTTNIVHNDDPIFLRNLVLMYGQLDIGLGVVCDRPKPSKCLVLKMVLYVSGFKTAV